jgi:hypothetical protein
MLYLARVLWKCSSELPVELPGYRSGGQVQEARLAVVSSPVDALVWVHSNALSHRLWHDLAGHRSSDGLLGYGGPLGPAASDMLRLGSVHPEAASTLVTHSAKW